MIDTPTLGRRVGIESFEPCKDIGLYLCCDYLFYFYIFVVTNSCRRAQTNDDQN